MKTLAAYFLVILSISIIFSGCFVKSVHPLVKQNQSIAMEGLEGSWQEESSRWTFSHSPHDVAEYFPSAETDFNFEDPEVQFPYLVIWENLASEITDSTLFMASFTEINNNTFMDLYPLGMIGEPAEDGNLFSLNIFADLHLLPVHTFARIKLNGSSMQIYFMKDSWMKDQIENNRVEIKHEKADDSILITASTEELRNFVTEHSNNEEAFEKPVELMRL